MTFGQSIGRINNVPTVQELVDRIVRDAEAALIARQVSHLSFA